MKKYLALLPLFILFWIAGGIFIPVSSAQEEQDEFVLQQAQELLGSMTAEERVGQLFLVTFEGSELDLESDLVGLIVDYQIGGVVFSAENDNYADVDSLPTDVARLTNSLQELAIVGQSSRIENSGEGSADAELDDNLGENEGDEAISLGVRGIPLFVGTGHSGGNRAEILSGLTDLPSQLAVGATWQPEMAATTGRILGSELNSLGFNLLLNPSLNVVENPDLLRGVSADGLIDSYGGNPYWVGRFGQAFVNGVNAGSGGRIAVIGGNFPGVGNSDRPLNREIATVRTTLQDMRQGDLAPFMHVADSNNLTRTIDGFMTAHLRYQGFQGNIDARSVPLSFDSQAIETLLQIEPLADWRADGGLLVSGELGVPAIRQFYANGDGEFPHRRVARDSLIAGNDLLFVGRFSADGADPSSEMANVQDTITWFNEQYATDSTFQLRVDEAVLRILQAKIRLYDGDLSLANVLIDEVSAESNVGIYASEISNIARAAVTQLSPRPEDNPEPLPGPPDTGDTIVIFTDVRETSQCANCASRLIPGPEDLEERILTLYGPDASSQVTGEQILSFSFTDLEDYLDSTLPIFPPTPEPVTATEGITIPVPLPVNFQVQEALEQAEWVIFAAHGVRNDVPASSSLKRLLTERPNVLSDSVVAVFSLGYPLDLDSTDISHLTAYYALYSPGEAFTDTAARVLFRDLPPRGAPSLNVSSVGYDLEQIIAPRPSQIIELFLEDELTDIGNLGPPELFPGDTLRLRTGVILDYNGNAVPDGTIVQFTQEDRVQGGYTVIAEVPTFNGQARFDYILEDRAGQFRLRASAGEAVASEEVDIAIIENESAQVVVITPTPEPTAIPTASPTPLPPTPTVTVPPTESPTQTPIPPVADEEPQISITLSEVQTLGSMLIGLIGVGFLGNASRSAGRSASGRLRKILWGLLFALIGYIWFLLDLPGSGWVPDFGAWRWIVVTFACGVPGIACAWLFNQIAEPVE